MAVTATVFAKGTMTTSLSTVYTVPGSSTAIVSYGSFHNKSGGSESMTLFFNGGTGDIEILNFTLGAGETFVFKEKPVLTTGYLIKVQASANSAIDYWITGGLVT